MMKSTDLPFMEHVRLIQLIRSVRQPSNDLCLDLPAGQALYQMAQSVERTAEHLHDVRRRRSRFNASGLPLPSGYLPSRVRQFLYVNDKDNAALVMTTLKRGVLHSRESCFPFVFLLPMFRIESTENFRFVTRHFQFLIVVSPPVHPKSWTQLTIFLNCRMAPNRWWVVHHPALDRYAVSPSYLH